MNRTKALAILAIGIVSLAVLYVYSNRSQPTAESANNLPAASGSNAGLPSRRFHIINLSMGQSGTESITALFARFRSEHEFMLLGTMKHVMDWREGLISGEALDAYLLERDHRSYLEVDSNTVLQLAQDRLIPLYPDAKFLLSVRKGADWLVSTMGLMSHLYETCESQKMFYDLPCSELIGQTSRVARTIMPNFKEEYFINAEHIATNIRPMLPDLAANWGNSTLTTLQNLSKLPPDRVLVIRTENIDYSFFKLAAFAGIDKSNLDLVKYHATDISNSYAFAKLIGEDKIAAAFQPWQAKVDARLSEMGIEPVVKAAGKKNANQSFSEGKCGEKLWCSSAERISE